MAGTNKTHFEIKSLGKCPECSSLRLGIIKPDIFDYERQAKYYFKKYHCFLKFADPAEWDAEVNANRFCLDCGYEWREEENFFKTNRFRTLTFADEKAYLSYCKASCYENLDALKDFHSSFRTKKKIFFLFKKGGLFDKLLFTPIRRINIFSDFCTIKNKKIRWK